MLRADISQSRYSSRAPGSRNIYRAGTEINPDDNYLAAHPALETSVCAAADTCCQAR